MPFKTLKVMQSMMVAVMPAVLTVLVAVIVMAAGFAGRQVLVLAVVADTHERRRPCC